MQNQDLLNRIQALEKKIQSLEQSSTISFQVDNSFQGRGFIKQNGLEIFTNPPPEGLSMTIALSGDPESITVPSFPFRYAKVTINGLNMFIPCLIQAEF